MEHHHFRLVVLFIVAIILSMMFAFNQAAVPDLHYTNQFFGNETMLLARSMVNY